MEYSFKGYSGKRTENPFDVTISDREGYIVSHTTKALSGTLITVSWEGADQEKINKILGALIGENAESVKVWTGRWKR